MYFVFVFQILSYTSILYSYFKYFACCILYFVFLQISSKIHLLKREKQNCDKKKFCMRPICLDIILKADLSRSQSDFLYYIMTENQSSTCFKMATHDRCLPSIFNGKFFKIDKIDGDKVTALCTHCPGMKSLSGYLSATTNFLTHLKV